MYVQGEGGKGGWLGQREGTESRGPQNKEGSRVRWVCLGAGPRGEGVGQDAWGEAVKGAGG